MGLCFDIAHGYADRDERVVWDGMSLLEASLPYVEELHLKNTDSIFERTFGFSEIEREEGVIDVEVFLDYLLAHHRELPVDRLVGYLELEGPKRGRDYSDRRLEESLRVSLRYLKGVFAAKSAVTSSGGRDGGGDVS
jgi:ribulose-phosphate 3-epimerase